MDDVGIALSHLAVDRMILVVHSAKLRLVILLTKQSPLCRSIFGVVCYLIGKEIRTIASAWLTFGLEFLLSFIRNGHPYRLICFVHVALIHTDKSYDGPQQAENTRESQF